jgi:hypothetical protein
MIILRNKACIKIKKKIFFKFYFFLLNFFIEQGGGMYITLSDININKKELEKLPDNCVVKV